MSSPLSIARSTALALAAAFVFATSMPAEAALRLSAGSRINAVLSSPDINTKNAQVGQTFTMRVVSPYPAGHSSLANATITGHITAVRSGGQGRTAQLSLAFDRMTLPNGQIGYLRADVVKLDTVNENTIARKGLGAGAGAAVGSQTIGRVLGGTLGSVVGLVGGAAGGYAYAKNDRPNFNLATGAGAILQTTRAMEVTRRQA